MSRSTTAVTTRILVSVVTVGLLVASCGGDDDSEDDSAADPVETSRTSTTDEPDASEEVQVEEVQVGFLAALSGPAAGANKPIEDGARAAVEWLNDGNAQADGVTYSLEVRDTAGDPNKTVVLIRELLDGGADVVLGEFGGATGFLAEQPAINEQGIVAFTTAPADSIWANAGMDKEYPWAFGIVGDQSAFATPLFETAFELTANDHVAQIFPNSGSAPEWAELGRQLASDAGVEMSEEEFPATATDLKSQLRNLESTGADTLLTLTYGTALQTIFVNLNEIGWYPKIVSLQDAGRQSLLEAVPAEVMQNVVAGPIPATMVTSDGSAPGGLTGQFLAAIAEVTGRGPGEYGAADISSVFSFDSMLAYDWALAKAGTTDPVAVRAALQDGTFDGAAGPHTWTADERSGFTVDAFAMFDPNKPCVNGSCVAP